MSGEGYLPNAPRDRREGLSRIPRSMIVCPVCGSNSTIHGSEHVTSLVKTLWVRCSNLECGMTWRSQLAFEYFISPSGLALPPGLVLPRAPPAASAAAPANFGGGGGDDPGRLRLAG